MPEDSPNEQADPMDGGRKKGFEQAYERTRKSLIARLENWEDQRTWDEFYQTYWRLIYSVGLKAGLRSDEAFDVVQETILSIAKQSRKQLYDPKQGSFKTWLMNAHYHSCAIACDVAENSGQIDCSCAIKARRWFVEVKNGWLRQ